MKSFKSLAVAAGLSIMTAGSVAAQALIVETGTAAGTTTLAMQVIANYGGMDLQINSGQTLTKSCMKLGQSEIDVAICPPPAHLLMMKGAGPYKNDAEAAKEASQKLRGLFAFSGGFFHPIVREGSGIEDWADIEGLRVFTGPPAGAANNQSLAILKAATGFTAGEDYESVRLGWGAALQAFQDGQFDMMMYPTAVGTATLEQLGPIRLLSLSDEALQTETWKKYTAQESRDMGVIPAGVYSNVSNTEGARTAEYTMQALVNEAMDDDRAYEMVKLFWENLDQAKGDIRTLGMIDPATPFKGMTAKLHPGAVRYYKEIGMEIPADKM